MNGEEVLIVFLSQLIKTGSQNLCHWKSDWRSKPSVNPKQICFCFVFNLHAVLSLGEAVLAKPEAKSRVICLLSEALDGEL